MSRVYAEMEVDRAAGSLLVVVSGEVCPPDIESGISQFYVDDIRAIAPNGAPVELSEKEYEAAADLLNAKIEDDEGPEPDDMGDD